MMNIEQPKNDKSGQTHPPVEAQNLGREFSQTGGGGQNRGWQKNQKQQRRKQYCFSTGKYGHSTRDCPDAKETQERIKNRAAPQPPPSLTQPRETHFSNPSTPRT